VGLDPKKSFLGGLEAKQLRKDDKSGGHLVFFAITQNAQGCHNVIRQIWIQPVISIRISNKKNLRP